MPLRLKSEIILLVFLILCAIFFRSFRLYELFPFQWDQERDALMVWQIIKDLNPTLIGPRALGPEAFFLGPLWYYLLVPFYLMTNMDPVGSGYFNILVGVLTTIGLYFLTKHLTNQPVSIMIAFYWATLADRVVWNPILIPLITILFIFCLSRAINGKDKSIILGFLLVGLGLHIHFQLIFLFIPLLLTILFHSKSQKRISVTNLILGLFLLLLTFIPLIIFDLRHNFLNFQSFINFFFHKSEGINLLTLITNFYNSLLMFFRFLIIPELSFLPTFFGLIFFLISVWGIWISKMNQNLKVILIVLISTPVVAFAFYKGDLTEYYFLLTLIPILLGWGVIIYKLYQSSMVGKIIVIVLFTSLISVRFYNLVQKDDPLSIYYKKQAVLHIINQKEDPIFNVSYTTPANLDSGFRYLFKLYSKEPVEKPEAHLWTIIIPAKTADVQPKAIYGDIAVIRR